MDNMFNFETFCNSLDHELDDILLTSLRANLTVMREDMVPFSTRGRYAKQVLKQLNKDTGLDKFIYYSRWYDSTQVALAYFCNELSYHLVIITDSTYRDNNAFSEIAKSLGAIVKYDSYLFNHDEYVVVPRELDHQVSRDILSDLFTSLNMIDFDEAWFTVEDCAMIPEVFKSVFKDKDINIVCVCDQVPKIEFECNKKIICDKRYLESCDPDYPSYSTNPYVDGKIWKYIERRDNANERKVLVFNKY